MVKIALFRSEPAATGTEEIEKSKDIAAIEPGSSKASLALGAPGVLWRSIFDGPSMFSTMVS